MIKRREDEMRTPSPVQMLIERLLYVYVPAALLVAITVIMLPPYTWATVFTIPESELREDAEFGSTAWGPGTLVGRSDGPGESVDFSFSALGPSGTGVKDDYPVDPVYGQVIPSHGNGDFSGFWGYALAVKNMGTDTVWVQLIMNTGFTGPSGNPSSDPTNNTFWSGWPAWTRLGPGDSLVLNLNFDYAVAYQISDNKDPHTGGGQGWPDGGCYAINAYDRSEVSAIGFEVADFSGTNPEASIRLTPDTTELASIEGGSDAGNRHARILVYPNPGIAFHIRLLAAPQAGSPDGTLTLSVFDVCGRLVYSRSVESITAVAKGFTWNGIDSRDRMCPPGFYFVKVGGNQAYSPTSLVLMR
jgi:hypothetical protein